MHASSVYFEKHNHSNLIFYPVVNNIPNLFILVLLKIQTMNNTFGIDIIPENERDRIAALRRYKISDTPPEGIFNNIARLATQIFQVPISLISIVDTDKVYFKANVGMGKARQTSRGLSLCSLAILKREVTIFENALEEPCLLANPNLAGEFGLKFYAGAPLTTHDGFRIGTLCIIDKVPRKFTRADELLLEGLAIVVMDEMELRLSALTEHDQLQVNNEELSAANDQMTDLYKESAAINEELIATNEELSENRSALQGLNEMLTLSETRFRSLFEQNPSGVGVLTGRELIIDSANALLFRIWGKNHYIIGKPLRVALPELEGQPFLQILDDVYTTGKAYYGNEEKVTLDYDGQLKDGFFNFVYQPLKDTTGNTYAIMVVATSVTEQVDARKAVNESNERLNLALKAGKLGSFDYYLPNDTLYCNEQFRENLGLTSHAAFSFSDWEKLILPEYRESVNQKFEETVSLGSNYDAEYQVYWPDGTRQWISANAVPRFDEDGLVNRIVGVTKNITARKAFDQRKDDFLGVVSHELKTPITTLKANLQLLERLKDDPANPMFHRLVESSSRSTEKINDLVEDLLNMRRFGEGLLRLEKSTFTIKEMLEVCCNHVRIAGTHELIIEGDENVQVFADEHRIDQVVVNFVNNAVKYAPESKRILMSIEKAGAFVKIAVRDFGPGIPENQIPHLFDRYWRANHSGVKYSGLGLGLYICADIIERHDGKIGVESELGKGSVFWFTLPLK
jgi:PAS domain S-box-containing protein